MPTTFLGFPLQSLSLRQEPASLIGWLVPSCRCPTWSFFLFRLSPCDQGPARLQGLAPPAESVTRDPVCYPGTPAAALLGFVPPEGTASPSGCVRLPELSLWRAGQETDYLGFALLRWPARNNRLEKLARCQRTLPTLERVFPLAVLVDLGFGRLLGFSTRGSPRWRCRLVGKTRCQRAVA
jgi:hypothetical protein